jgi:transcription-repair coupling factor (superfamily II helicase)
VFYRRLAAAPSGAALSDLEAELVDRYGRLPLETLHLLWLLQLKLLLKSLGIAALTAGPNKVSLVPGPHPRLDHQKAIALMAAFPKTFQILPDSKLVLSLEFSDPRTLFQGISIWLDKLTASLH